MKAKAPKAVKRAEPMGNPPPNPLAQALELQLRGEIDKAEAAFRAILASAPDEPVSLYSLGVIALGRGRNDEALEFFRTGCLTSPSFAQNWLGYATTLQGLGQREQALLAYDEAIKAKPDYLEAFVNSGVLLRDMHRHHEALARFNQALAIDPDYPNALGNCAILLTEFKESAKAIAMLKHLLQKAPDYDYGLGLLLYEQLHIGEWTDFAALRERIVAGVREGRRVCKSLAFMALSDDAADHHACAKTFARHYCPPAKKTPLWNGEEYRHEKIRLAYVSPDLREHPVGHLMCGIFEGHDRSRFETIAISLGIDDDSRLRRRMLDAFDHFIDVRGWTSQRIAETMRQMEVDVAIDLAGYTADSRIEIFSWRPAPVQINFLGYPGTLAVDYMDYILADRHVIPPEHQTHFSEKVLYLPDTYLPTDRNLQIAEETPTREACGLPPAGVVFCSFSHEYKISPPLWAVWMSLLRRVPDSVLWLTARNALTQENFRRSAAECGVAPERIVFANRVPRVEDHLARYRLADVFLDTWPYNAHTTAADALAAGLPVVTYMGGAFPARVAGSLLHAVGLPELVTGSWEDYERLAYELVTDQPRLAGLKAKLAANKLTEPLFDTERFCRNLEAAVLSVARTAPAPAEGPAKAMDAAPSAAPPAVPAAPQAPLRGEFAPTAPVPGRGDAPPAERDRYAPPHPGDGSPGAARANTAEVLVPIYKPTLDTLEEFSLRHSLGVLSNHRQTFFAPRGLDISYYAERFPAGYRFFDPAYFESTHAYSKLLVSEDFYRAFPLADYLLILQPDVYVFRDDLAYWLASGYDYVGAPWPGGLQLRIEAGRFAAVGGLTTTAFVGNGGFSLRRREACIDLLGEFQDLAAWFYQTGSNEDLFFSLIGGLSSRFRIPNQLLASRFSVEVDPEYYIQLNAGTLPMGAHSFAKYSPEFWRTHIKDWPEVR